jgi:hypothetical protein
MPKPLQYKNLEFYFLSADLKDNRMQINVSRKGERKQFVKFWIEPTVEIAVKNGKKVSGDFSEKEINLITKIVEKYLNVFKNAVKDFENGKKIKTIRIS